MHSEPFPSPEPNEQLLEQLRQLRHHNELLKAQLMNTSLVNELTRVLQSCSTLSDITNTVLLGIQEIVGFDRVILFTIQPEDFCIRSSSWVGFENDDVVKQLHLPLGFEGGEITDAIFLNRHIIVDSTSGGSDIFTHQIGSDHYLVMPLLSKAARRCFEHHECKKTTCPAHGGHNPYCWSIQGAGQLDGSVASEDERRKACVQCSSFKCEGVIWMDKALKKTPITSDDISMLSAIINVGGIIIENLRINSALENANGELQATNHNLHVVNRDLQIAQSKLDTDLQRARTIQFGLLPQALVDTSVFVIGTHYTPAAAVGGDYYDVFQIDATKYGIVVADVSGHGISSALIMAMVKVLLKSYAVNECSPQKTLERINHTFIKEIISDNFVTIYYAVLDTQNRTYSFTSAGHCPILMIDKESYRCNQVKADGLFMGVFEDMMLKQTTLSYSPTHTRLVLYTDGLTEQRSSADEMYGLTRLQESALACMGAPPPEAVKLILEHQRAFCNHGEPEDDITLLVIDI
jgi:serine phosphatase RsbU (regulator of sigma subunit)